MKAKTAIGLGIIALGVFFVPTAIAVSSLSLAFGGVRLLRIEKNLIRLGVLIDFTNTSIFSATIQKVNIAVYMNGHRVGWIKNNYNQVIYQKSTTPTMFQVDIIPGQVGQSIWAGIFTGTNFLDNYVQIVGTASVSGKKVPLNFSLNTNEFIEE